MDPLVNFRLRQIENEAPEPEPAGIEASAPLLDEPIPNDRVSDCLAQPHDVIPVAAIQYSPDDEAAVSLKA